LGEMIVNVTPAVGTALGGSARILRRETRGQVDTVKTRQGRVRNRAVREKSLLAAASRLFATRGYEATTTREIASEADCAEGLIHRYFQGKEGLLLALIRERTSREFLDMNQRLRLAPSLPEEVVQLVEFELDRMWEDREFLKVVVPRAHLDPHLGPVLNRIGPSRRAQAIGERLRAVRKGQNISDRDLEILSHFIGVLGFIFGYMRPVVLGDDPAKARDLAIATAKMLVRGL
jgi:AcrR family transcriptional regulator